MSTASTVTTSALLVQQRCQAQLVDDLSGKVLGGYAVGAEIGRGGMAIVYYARQLSLDRECALKVLKPELAGDEHFVERFLREARAAANLRHPNIVTIYDTGEIDGHYFIAMEYLEGQTLREFVTSPERDPAAMLSYLDQVAAALDYAHNQGIIHRDIKPSNIIITNDGTVKLTDFGIARSLTGTQLTMTGMLLGTPAYMAPEQVQGDEITTQTDVYQLGVVTYELLAGEPPFANREPHAILYAHFQEQPAPVHQRAQGLTPQVSTVIDRALKKLPGDRYPSCTEFVDQLKETLRVAPPVPVSLTGVTSPDEPTRKSDSALVPPRAGTEEEFQDGRRWWWIVAPIIILLVVLASAAGYLILASNGGNGTGVAITEPTATESVVSVTSTSTTPALVGGAAEATATATQAPTPTVTSDPGELAGPSPGEDPGCVIPTSPSDSLELIGDLPRRDGSVLGVSFSPDPCVVASAGEDGVVRVWNWQSAEELAANASHTDAVRRVNFSPDGLIVTAGIDGLSIVWDWTTDTEIELAGHADRVNDAVFSPDGELVVTASHDGMALVWDWRNQQIVATLEHPDSVISASFGHDGMFVVTGSADGFVRVWDWQSEAVVSEFATEEPVWINSAVFSPDRAVVAAASLDGYVRIWDWSAMELLAENNLHPERIFEVSFSADARHVASTGDDGLVRIWEWQAESVSINSVALETIANSVRFATNANILAIGRSDGLVQIMSCGSCGT